jgi:DNA-binding MarR family transcriptional regulator
VRTPPLSDQQFADLLAFRVALRRFLVWSEDTASAAGLTAAQHQLLVAVRGHPDLEGPTISDVADYLLIRHHSAVGLIDRAETAGLVHRQADTTDLRVVRIRLTRLGTERVELLARSHLQELARIEPILRNLLAETSMAHWQPSGEDN